MTKTIGQWAAFAGLAAMCVFLLAAQIAAYH